MRVQFTGLAVDAPTVIAGRALKGDVPPEWPWCRFAVPDGFRHSDLDRWLHIHMFGRWSVRFASVDAQPYLTIAFEDANDAVLFRLKGGETAWTVERP